VVELMLKDNKDTMALEISSCSNSGKLGFEVLLEEVAPFHA